MQTSPEVQNRCISGPTKRTVVHQKFEKLVLTYEVVGDGSHTVVLPHSEAHQEVPADSYDEDNEVDDDEDPLGRGRLHVTHDHVDVLVVRHAVIVRAHRDVRGVGPRGIGRRRRERFRVHWTGVLEVRD